MSDPNWTDVELLMRCNGTNGSTVFTDSGPLARSISINGGSPVISTTESKFGGASVRFPGSASLNLGTGYDFSGAFTIECQLWYDTQARNAEVLFSLNGSSAGNYFYFIKLSGGGIGCSLGSLFGNFTTAGFVANAWNHVAFVRNGSGVVNMFANGVKNGPGSGEFTGPYNPSTARTLLCGNDASVGNSLIGYLDEIRITTGVARYTADFDPPTAEFDGAPPPVQRNWRKTQYLPGTQGSDLVTFTRNELERINNATESGWTHELLDKLTQEPTRKRVGMKVYADGSLWNPGSGEGVYILTSSGWQKLG